MSSENVQPLDPLLTMAQVRQLTSLSRATIYRFIGRDQFPRPVRLSVHGRVGWRQSDVRAWMESPLDWNRVNDL